MANIFINLPLPAANGAGATTAVGTIGALKTIVVGGTGFPGASVTIQASYNGTTWTDVKTFSDEGDQFVIKLACTHMRTFVQGRGAVFNCNVDVGGNDDGCQAVALTLPALNGAGAAVDISHLGGFKTAICQGNLAGATMLVEVSEDGTDWAAVPISYFNTGGHRSHEFHGYRARVSVSGRVAGDGFAATIGLAAGNDAGGGGTLGRVYSPPEKWHQENVAADQTDVDLSCLVSVNFDNIKMIRGGSIVGLSTRFSAAITDATADSCVVTVTVNGASGTLSLSHSSGTNPSGGQATQATGIDTFNAGDLVGIEITTLGTFAPTTTDIEAWLDIAYA